MRPAPPAAWSGVCSSSGDEELLLPDEVVLVGEVALKRPCTSADGEGAAEEVVEAVVVAVNGTAEFAAGRLLVSLGWTESFGSPLTQEHSDRSE